MVSRPVSFGVSILIALHYNCASRRFAFVLQPHSWKQAIYSWKDSRFPCRQIYRTAPLPRSAHRPDEEDCYLQAFATCPNLDLSTRLPAFVLNITLLTMNNGNQGRPGPIPAPPIHQNGPRSRLPATIVQQPAITQPRNPQMSHQHVHQSYRATPQAQAPHPSASIVPHQLNRVAEQSDLRGENLTEDEYREFLTEYIIYRFEKVESHDLANSNGDQPRGSWANCTRRRLPAVDKQEAKKEINNLNKEDRRKGRTLLEKQRSLASEQQDQLKKLEGDLSNDEQLDSRFQIVLVQVHSTLKPIVDKHESFSRRHNAMKRKVRDKKKYERTSIVAYFKRCPRPEQIPSLLYRQLELEKHQVQQLHERQARQQDMFEQMREQQERERAEESRRVAQQQAHQQQQQVQLLKQQNQLQGQQAQLQKQQALQQQRPQQTQQQQQQQQQVQKHTQHPDRVLTRPQPQGYPMRPGQGQAGQVQMATNRSHQAGHQVAQHHTSPIQANIGRQVPHAVHGVSRVLKGDTIRVNHEHDHRDKNHAHRRQPSIISSESGSLFSEDDSSSCWDSDTGSEKDSDSTPTSIPSRSSGSYRARKPSHSNRHHVHKHLSHHKRRSPNQHHHRPSHKHHESRYSKDPKTSGVDGHRSRRYSLHGEREPPAYILTASDQRVPVRAPHVPQRDVSPVVSAKNIEAMRTQAYHNGRMDQIYEDQARLATVAAESLDARRYQIPPSSTSPTSALRYEPRTAPRPVIVTEREIPSIRHVSHSEVERQLDHQYMDDVFGRLRLADLERGHDVRGIEDDYEILLPDRVPLRRRASFVRVDRSARSSPHWTRAEDDEDWDRVGRGGVLGRERRRDSRSPSALMTAASYRNPFIPEPLRPGRVEHVFSPDLGRQRLF